MEEWSYKALDCFWRNARRWRRRSLHDKILIGITAFAVLAVAVSLCMLDSQNWLLFFSVAVVGCVWILLFTYANMRSCSEIPNS